MAEPLRFHFDYISPYACLGWTQIHALAAKHGRTVEPVPVLFAGLLDAHGTKGPAEIPAKRIYVAKDAMRKARVLGLKLAPPPSHPFNPLLALRISSLPLPAEARKAVIDRFFVATWGDGPGVTDPAVLARLVSECGVDGAQAIADATTPEGKERVRAQTERAVRDGVFGVPTIIASNGSERELFWGVDSLEHLDRFLGGEPPLDPETMARWSKIAPSAERKQR
jgi:2-hydroxychromene-2-carboxylate isomerase